MDGIWQWAWDRYATKYSWALCAVLFVMSLPVYLLLPAFLVVTFEGSSHYVEAAALTIVALPVMVYVTILPGVGAIRVVERYAAGRAVDRETALAATYTWSRGLVARTVWGNGVWAALLFVAIGAIAGAPGSRMVQYAILGAVFGAIHQLIAIRGMVEATMRPVRLALAGGTGIGDALPRARPSFAAWSSVSMIAVAFAYTVAGAMLAAVFDWFREVPVFALVIGLGLTLVL